jgi:hypothetical protein
MWTSQVVRITKAPAAAIWALWADVANWPRWDTDVISAVGKGPFEKGMKGVLKPKGGPKTRFVLTEVTALQSFTSKSRLPLGSLQVAHSLRITSAGLEVSHSATIKGPLTFLFSRIIGAKLAASQPQAIEQLVALAEATEA